VHLIRITLQFCQAEGIDAPNDMTRGIHAVTRTRLKGLRRVHATASESRVLQAVPGAMVLLGACPPGIDPDTAASNHSGAAVFDDSVLADGAQFYAELALRRLARETGTALAAGR
jgi:metal-dependent amidase/aminoacylase/carboxypeptidase family protein